MSAAIADTHRARRTGPESQPPDADGQPGVLPTDGEDGDLLDSDLPRLKSVDIGLFARFPKAFFSSGMARKLGTSALCENANRNRTPSNTFAAADKTLAWETGLSPRTLRNVRIKLMENGLVEYGREPGQKYTYTLLRQELKWLKVAERPPRQKQRPRGMAAARAKLEP